MPTPTDTPAPNVIDAVLLNLRDTCDAVTSMMGARDFCLHLAPDAGEHLRQMLQAGGIALGHAADADVAFARRDAATPIDDVVNLRRMRAREGAPTDAVDLALDIALPSGTLLAFVELRGVPVCWIARHRVAALLPLSRLVGSQVCALSQGPALLARPMLALATQLQGYDSNVISHAFLAFLRVLSGETPTQVEVTALRIAGLADVPTGQIAPRDVALNDVAHGVLEKAGLGRARNPVAVAPHEAVAMPEPEAPLPAGAHVPFARLRLVERDFAIADDAETGRLLFRPLDEAAAGWMRLSNGPCDGWTAVASEILGQVHDIAVEFSRMHVIRRRDLPTDEIAEAYELEGVIWWLRSRAGGLEARLDGGDWAGVATGPDMSPKARAIAALFEIDDGARYRLADAARDWASRMAHTVQVSPMVVAAE